jgi:hypothetical protein
MEEVVKKIYQHAKKIFVLLSNDRQMKYEHYSHENVRPNYILYAK